MVIPRVYPETSGVVEPSGKLVSSSQERWDPKATVFYIITKSITSLPGEG